MTLRSLSVGGAKLVMWIVALLALLIPGMPAPAHAFPVTTSVWGHPGYWDTELEDNVCAADSFGGWLALTESLITRSPAYPNSVQTVTVVTRVERWDGARWVLYTSRSRSTLSYPGNNLILVSNPKTVAVPRKNYYRVVQSYTWAVNGQNVGRATNLFDQDSYMTFGGAWIAPTGRSPSYCYIY